MTVPPGVDPGPVTVTVTVTAGQATSSVLLSVLERSADAFVGDLVDGLGLSPDEGTLYALTNTNPPKLLLIDATSLANGATSVPVGGPTSYVGSFTVSPDGTRGLIFDDPQIHVIEVPSGALVGTCPRSPQIGSYEFAPQFDDQGRFAFTPTPRDAPAGEEGFLRVNLLDGSCDYFMTGPDSGYRSYLGLLFQPFLGLLLVSDRTRGYMYVDIETGLPTTNLELPAFGQPQLFRGLAGPNRIYGVGYPQSDLVAIDLFSGRSPTVLRSHSYFAFAAQTRNRRWLFVGNHSYVGYFVDLDAERIARDAVPSLVGYHLTAGVSSFFIDTDNGLASEQIRRFTIR